ncbi:MAG: MazG nucleotide pyrophosphohydrolase domain-containing protein [Nocardioides sp.]
MSRSAQDGDRTAEPLLAFRADMERLRRECPWKREQTHRSLARYLQEEAAEALEAIDLGDPAHLREELGDLLLQIYFHAVVAEEAGDFTLDDVARGIADKMHRRNPHVFGPDGGATTLSATEVNQRWQEIKAAERTGLEGHETADDSPYHGIGPGLSALLTATKVLERRPAVARDLPDPGDRGADLGDRLLALVAEAGVGGVDPEQALRDALRRVVAG